jgi:hypothetical protein
MNIGQAIKYSEDNVSNEENAYMNDANFFSKGGISASSASEKKICE